ncbi:MAG: hypothetical protein AAGJ46_12195 [Planctomycetota bacterium]
MAVTSCKIVRYLRGSMIAGNFRYGIRYEVTTDDKEDPWPQVWLQAQAIGGAGNDPLPAYNTHYNVKGRIDLAAFARSFSGDQREQQRTIWDVDVFWENLPLGQLPEDTQTPFDNPLAAPAKNWIEFQTLSEIIEQDYQGNPIVNSAGQPFDEPAEEDNEYEVLVFEKNFATLTEIRLHNRNYRRKLNDDTYAGYPAKHCLCLPILASPPKFAGYDPQSTGAGMTYYTGSARVICSDRPWVREFVNRGFKHFVGTGSDKKLVLATDPTTDANGDVDENTRVVVTEPVLLDTDGYRLPLGDAGNIRTFQTRGEADFDNFPFPLSA